MAVSFALVDERRGMAHQYVEGSAEKYLALDAGEVGHVVPGKGVGRGLERLEGIAVEGVPGFAAHPVVCEKAA